MVLCFIGQFVQLNTTSDVCIAPYYVMLFLQCIANPDGGGCKIDCGSTGNRYMKDDSHEKEKVIDLAPGDKGSKAVKLTLQLNG